MMIFMIYERFIFSKEENITLVLAHLDSSDGLSIVDLQERT